MAIEIFRLVGSVFVDTDDANKSLKKTDENAESIGKKLSDGIKTAAKWGAGLVAAAGAGVAALTGVATNAAAAMDVIDKGSAKIGISKQAYQEWSYVLGQNGMDISKLEVGMKTLVAATDRAAEGNAAAIASFEALGISIYDSNGGLKDQETLLNESLYALANMENGTEKARLATELFGKAGVEMMPMLNGGAEGMEELTMRAHDLGLVFSDEAVTAGVVLGDTMDDVKQSFAAIVTQLGANLMPVVQNVLDWVIEHIPEIQSICTSAFSTIETAVDGLVGAYDACVQGFKDLKAWAAENETALQVVAIAVGTLTAAVVAYNVAQAVQHAGGIAQVAQLALLQVQLWGLEIAESAVTLAQIVATAATTAWGAAIAFLTSPITLVVAAIGALIAVVVLLVKNWDTVKETAGKVWDWITGRWEKTGSWFKEKVFEPLGKGFSAAWDKVKDIWGGMKTWFSNLLSGVKTLFSNIASSLGNIFKSPVNTIIRGINSFISGLNKIKIPDWVPGVGGKGLNIPTIPLLAEGAVLEKGQTGFLEGNGAEAVVPLHNNKKWISAVAQDMADNGIGGNSAVSRELLDAFTAFVAELPDILAGAFPDTLNVNKREFARLVRAV